MIAIGASRGAYWLWSAALMVQFGTPYLIGIDRFRLEPAHFVERHGLLMLVTCLWWAYFTGDSERAVRALRTAAPQRQPQLASDGFFYAHIPMLPGVVLIAAGVASAIGHAGEPLATVPAVGMAGRVLLYLVGDVTFRRTLGIGSATVRAAPSVLALGTIPMGFSSAAPQLRKLG